MNKLEDIQNDGDLKKGMTVGQEHKTKCIIDGLELDIKYVVTYVAYNVTAKSEGKGKDGFGGFHIMFLVAY